MWGSVRLSGGGTPLSIWSNRVLTSSISPGTLGGRKGRRKEGKEEGGGGGRGRREGGEEEGEEGEEEEGRGKK